MTTPHKHAALIKQFAEDMTIDEKLVSKWQIKLGSDWETLIYAPQWYEDCEYRREPNTINVNGVEVPEPCREPLTREQKYWLVCSSSESPTSFLWMGDATDLKWFALGMIHLTKESAQAHVDALLIPSKITL